MQVLRASLRLPLAFFASGASALLFEVLWFRALGRLLGNTVWAGALVLTAFMLGIAFGGMLVARLARWNQSPSRTYAAAELAIGLSGCLLVFGLPAMERIVGQLLSPFAAEPALVNGARLALALLAMLVPTVAMGMTLPLGVRMLAGTETHRALGTLYAANTLGAALAPMVAEYHLIGAFGLRGTALSALLLNLFAAGLVLSLRPAAAAACAPTPVAASPLPPWRLLLIAASAGALMLGLEVAWLRLLLLHTDATDTAFAFMLMVLLAGIALGGALAAASPGRPSLEWTLAATCAAVVLGYAVAQPGAPEAHVALYAIPLMLPAATLSGLLFTRLGAQLRSDAGNPQASIGHLTWANTLGGAAGSAVTALVLLPRIGIESSIFALALGYAALLPLLLTRRLRWPEALPGLVAIAGLALFPFGLINAHLAGVAARYSDDGSTVAQVTQGPTVTLQLMRRDAFGEPVAWRLVTDHFSMTATDAGARRYMQMFAWLPLALHPQPRDALLISYGAGNTARALLSDPGLESLTVVDLSPEILAASPLIHGTRDPLADVRTRVIVEDGRQFLLTSRATFDVITSEPPPLAMAGVVNLYTREYFAMLHERLAPGGRVSYWLPALQLKPDGNRAVIAAFCSVFEDCSLWAGHGLDWILLGGREVLGPPAARQFARLWREPASARLLYGNGLERPEQLGAAFIADASQLRASLGEVAPVNDDHPKRLAAPDRVAQNLPMMERYAELMRADVSAMRFSGSEWVSAYWPRELQVATQPYFAVQPLVNGVLPADRAGKLSAIKGLLASDLRVPILWLLDSDVPEQDILLAESAQHPHSDQAGYAYHLGVGALAARDYALAARWFEQDSGAAPKRSGVLAVFSHCLAGQSRLAREQADRLVAQGLPSSEVRCW